MFVGVVIPARREYMDNACSDPSRLVPGESLVFITVGPDGSQIKDSYKRINTY